MANTNTPAVPASDDVDQVVLSAPRSERLSAEMLQERFAGLLGITPGLPRAEWKAVGDPETLSATVLSTVGWMEQALIWKSQVTELPFIPQIYEVDPKTKLRTGQMVPAPGTRSVFDACLAGYESGLTPSRIKSCWDTAYRAALSPDLVAPGFKNGR